MATKKKTTAPAKKASPKSPTAVKKVTSAPRAYVLQEDVPAYALDDALRVPTAIMDNYGGASSSALDVASGLNLQPGSSQFRMLCGAAIAYGLTEGGYNAGAITPTPLAKRILSPLEEGDDIAAKREAVLKPRILREFLSKYSGSPLPRIDIGHNVLKSMGVPSERTSAVWDLILATADSVGYVRTIKDKQYIDLGGTRPATEKLKDDSTSQPEISSTLPDAAYDQPALPSSEKAPIAAQGDPGSRRVFITHGKNTAFIEPIKKLLGFGEMIPVVSVEKQSVSQPVPDKVMNDMRTCNAAIIHVDGEQTLIDQEAKQHTVINPNVLIEIGAAMALYGRRFILLVRNGVKLPSNLQGLYEVRYDGDALDGDVTIRLLEAINDMKNTRLPGQISV